MNGLLGLGDIIIYIFLVIYGIFYIIDRSAYFYIQIIM